MNRIKTLIGALKETGGWKGILFYSSWSLTLTSGLSYFFGLLRDRLLSRNLGLSDTYDIYQAAFVIPDTLLALMITTALSAAFVPIFSKQHDKEPSLGYQYAHQVISWGMLLIGISGIIIAITLPYFAERMVSGFSRENLEIYIQTVRILLLSPILFTLSNVYGQTLISFKELFWYGLSPALYNLGIILGIVFLMPSLGLNGILIGTLFGILLHMANRLRALKTKKYNFRHKIDFKFSPEIKETLWLMLPKILQYGAWYFMILQFTNLASTLGEGSVVAYNQARNFQSFPVSLLGIAIATALFPSLSHDSAKGDFDKFKKDFRKGRIKSLVYTCVAAIGLAVIARPMIQILFGGGEFDEQSVSFVASVLQVYCLSIPLESLMHVYHRAYFSLENTLIPSLSHGLNLLIAIAAALILSKTIGIYAIPVGFALGHFIHLIIIASIFPFFFKKKELSYERLANGER